MRHGGRRRRNWLTFSNPKNLSLPSARMGLVSAASSFSSGVGCGALGSFFVGATAVDGLAGGCDAVSETQRQGSGGGALTALERSLPKNELMAALDGAGAVVRCARCSGQQVPSRERRGSICGGRAGRGRGQASAAWAGQTRDAWRYAGSARRESAGGRGGAWGSSVSWTSTPALRHSALLPAASQRKKERLTARIGNAAGPSHGIFLRVKLPWAFSANRPNG